MSSSLQQTLSATMSADARRELVQDSTAACAESHILPDKGKKLRPFPVRNELKLSTEVRNIGSGKSRKHGL